MAIVRINEFTAAPGKAADLRAFLASVISVIEDADGCVACELLTDREDDARLVIVETWESVAAHQAAAAKIPPGQMAQFRALVAEPPKGRYYERASARGSHPRIVEILEHLDRHRAALRAAVESVPVEARERRPVPSRWSVAEVLEHLAIVESQIASLIRTRIENARQTGVRAETETTSVLPSLEIDRLLDRSTRLVSGDAALPKGDLDAASAWAKLDDERAALRQAVLAADGLALGDLSAPHRRLGSLNLYQWVIFLGGHEGRHALQIREIGETLAGTDA
jgi:quinol monooxygenase YgiN